MNIDELLQHEETLDPDDWESTRAIGHRMVDDMMDFLSTIREKPAWQAPTSVVTAGLQTSLGQSPQGLEKTYEDFLKWILPYPKGNVHPRSWGWVNGTGSVTGMLAELLASGMNPNCASSNHSAIYVERQVIAWFISMLGYSAEAEGTLVSGGSMANLTALAVARNVKLGFDVRTHGLRSARAMPTLYGSSETHSSNQKAIELLGFGNQAFRRVPVDDGYRIRLDALRDAIKKDRREGSHPFCIIGNAGTTNTGSIDDLDAMAQLAQEEGLWFHVDGAFGALAALTPEFSYLKSSLARADSLAFDLHKWLYVPYEAGCVLVKHPAALEKSFELTPSYLLALDRGMTAGPKPFFNQGFELSRGFRALKVWFMLKENGIDKHARLIRQNIAQARYLSRLIEANPHVELIAPVPLNVICFRFRTDVLTSDALNRLNAEILMQLQESGIAAPNQTILNGKFAIRLAIVNHRSRKEDFDLLVQEVTRIGQNLLQKHPYWKD